MPNVPRFYLRPFISKSVSTSASPTRVAAAALFVFLTLVSEAGVRVTERQAVNCTLVFRSIRLVGLFVAQLIVEVTIPINWKHHRRFGLPYSRRLHSRLLHQHPYYPYPSN